jgi:hypothetical protein
MYLLATKLGQVGIPAHHWIEHYIRFRRKILPIDLGPKLYADKVLFFRISKTMFHQKND